MTTFPEYVCAKCHGPLFRGHCSFHDIPKPETRSVYDMFEVLEYISRQEGYLCNSSTQEDRLAARLAGREEWHREVLNEIEFPGNDCHIDYLVSDPESPYQICDVSRQFDAGLIKYFGFKIDDAVLFHISW